MNTLYLVFHETKPHSRLITTKFQESIGANQFRDRLRKEGLLAEVHTLQVGSFKGHKLQDR